MRSAAHSFNPLAHPRRNRAALASRTNWRNQILLHSSLRYQMWIFKLKARKYLSLAADEHHTLDRKLFVVDLKLLRRRGTHPAVVPHQVHRGSFPACWIFEAEGAGRRKGKVVIH